MQSIEAFAPFYVQTRSFQRRILRSALELTEGDVAWAASAMGLEMTTFVEFCETLGGVFPGSTAIEPPPFVVTAAPVAVDPDPDVSADSESSAQPAIADLTSETPPGEFLSREDVEKVLGLSTPGVLRLHSKGEIQSVFDRERGLLLFRRDTVEEYANKRQTQREAKKSREEELASTPKP